MSNGNFSIPPRTKRFIIPRTDGANEVDLEAAPALEMSKEDVREDSNSIPSISDENGRTELLIGDRLSLVDHYMKFIPNYLDQRMIIGNNHEYIDELLEGSHCFLEDVEVSYSGSLSIDLEKIDDFYDSELNPIVDFSCENGGMLMPEVVDALLRVGVDRFKGIQYFVYRLLFPEYSTMYDNSDLLVLSPTGSGKSYAYMIPLFQLALKKDKKRRRPSGLIFCPTQPLASAAKKTLNDLIGDLDVKVSCFTKGERNVDLEFDIGIFTFGSFLSRRDSLLRRLASVQLIVIDESDRMLEDLDVVKNLIALKKFCHARVLQFSATINNTMNKLLNMEDLFIIVGGVTNTVTTNVVDKYYMVSWAEGTKLCGEIDPDFIPMKSIHKTYHPFDVLFSILKRIKASPMKVIVFVKRKNIAQQLVLKLLMCDFKAALIHGDFEAAQRNTILERFGEGRVDILVGTQLIARGVDFDADHVINYDLPVKFNEFIHRCGRAGRNENVGYTYNFIDFENPDDYSPDVVHRICKSLRERCDADKYDFDLLPRQLAERCYL